MLKSDSGINKTMTGAQYTNFFFNFISEFLISIIYCFITLFGCQKIVLCNCRLQQNESVIQQLEEEKQTFCDQANELKETIRVRTSS